MIKPQAFRKRQTPEGFVAVDPMPNEAELAKFYSEVYYQQQVTATYQAEYTDDELRQKRVRCDLLVHAIGAARGKSADGARFLDVGCGEGFVLASAAASGYAVEGVEFSDYAVKKFNPEFADRVEFGNAFEILGRRIGCGDSVDVCTLQNVLEHVRDPLSLLRSIRSILGKNGFAAVTVPNDFSRVQLRAMELGFVREEYWFAPPQHLQYFNCTTLPEVMSGVGLVVVDAFSDFPVDLFLYHPGSNYALDVAQGKNAHFARVNLDLLLAENGLEKYHNFCRAMMDCGIGRNITVIVKAR